MIHKIPFSLPQGSPLPVPHFLGYPGYTPDLTYDIIIPKEMELSEQDTIIMTHSPESMYRKPLTIMNIVERRPAKGDWSKQKIHKQPHFVRFIAAK